MKYLVLARRYRPQTFRDVIGQEAIITTLKNALRFDRIAHAYLFSGSRGVGKTTVARLFAKALNCQNLSADHEPCNQCPSCLEILSGQSLDVIEIDGASNRGIDDIRQLNETIGYAPSHGKYKIYIIDEVHMLTKEAFNALLKTLEEPPERAKFFFATTEPHKVLPTIVSRCQRFDLQRLTEAEIAGKLLSIASDLQREASPEAIHLISTFSEGSLRDAESLFDQILCFTDGPVAAEHVRNVLGLVPDELLLEFDAAFAEGRTPFAFTLVERLFQMGKDLGHFTEQLIGHYRRLILAKTLGMESMQLPEPLSSHINASAKLYTQAQLFYILDSLLASYAQLQKSPMQRVSLEAILLQILRSKNRIPVEVLIRRLSELEQKLLAAAPALPEIEAAPAPKVETPSAPPLPIAPPVQAIVVEKESDPLKPVPFNPFHPREILDPSPPQRIEAEKTNVPTNERDLKNPAVEAPAPQSPERKVNPGQYETLLRFAAVELEGTIKN
jgi:DNA polymerase III subunit gamma/tau